MEHLELVDRLYFAVKQKIFDQELLPGTKLVQEKLAAELGVSRSPLLKALQRLESELLVESIPRRGMYVKQLVPNEVRDIFQCRAVIEGLSARLTAEKATPAQVAELEQCFASFAPTTTELDAYSKADRRFHQLILNMSGNAVVNRLELFTSIQTASFGAGLLRPPAETLGEHRAIVGAISRKDGPEAERLMRLHITRSEQRIPR